MKENAFQDMKMVLEHCGFDILMSLLEFLPGVTINIPSSEAKRNVDIELVEELCGSEVVKSLRKNIPGISIYIPNFNNHGKDKIVQSFIQNIEISPKIKKLAIILGITERTVYNLNKENV